MKEFVIISDSSCNLNSEQLKEYGIAAVLPMHFYMDDVEYDASGDWITMSAKEYYDRIRGGVRLRSSQVSSKEYEKVFRVYLEQGYDILSVSCCEALSSSIKESIAAAERLKNEFPDAVIRCVDSYNCCYSLAMVLIECSKLRAAGKTIDEICSWIMKERSNFNEVGTVDKLTYLRNAGRVSASAAFFGGLFSVKPVVVYDETGHNVAVEKVRGRKGSLDRIAEYVLKYGDVDKNRNICIAHADCLEDAEYVGEKLKELFPGKDLLLHYGYVEPGIGSSCGPGTVIVDFYGSPDIRKLNG